MLKCGIDIGGTNIKFGFFDGEKKVNSVVIKTPKVKEKVIPSIVCEIKKKYKPSDILGYTVAIPGVVLNDVVVFAPNTDIKIKSSRSVALASAIAWRLASFSTIILSFSSNKPSSSLKFKPKISVLGGGIIIDGKLLNKNGFAGEIGHIKVHFGANSRMCGCGKLGCSEAYVSCKAIVKDYNDINHTNVNSKELFDLARAKDKLAIKCINDCARYLAITIATVVATTGIKEVHIAGGLSNAGEAFLRNVRYHYPKYCVRNMEDVKIKQAYLQYEAGTYAAKYLIGDEKNVWNKRINEEV